jgi:hypothetical protein
MSMAVDQLRELERQFGHATTERNRYLSALTAITLLIKRAGGASIGESHSFTLGRVCQIADTAVNGEPRLPSEDKEASS